jgi:RHS repeat-associated protein
MLTAAKEAKFSACTDSCVFFPLAAGGVYPKTRVWGSSEKTLHCFSATAQLRIELRRGCEKSSGKTTAGSALDYNGNTQTKVVGSNTTSYAWDFENRMSSVTLPGSGGTVSFKYDPFGRRIYKSSSSGTSVFAYDGDNLIEETNSSGAVVARYEPTQNIDEPLAMLRSGATSYFHADGLGSVTSLSTAAGSIANTYTYDSFGKLTASTGSLVNPFQYTAREFDPETSLYNYRARYYDPSTGRFLVEDPMRFRAGVDFYRYVTNNPANWTDPFGLLPDIGCACKIAAGAAAGGIAGGGIGGKIGGVLGGLAGGIVGGLGGGAVGSVEPGGGTLAGGAAGAIAGAGEGAAIGSSIGTGVGAAVGALLGGLLANQTCSSRTVTCWNDTKFRDPDISIYILCHYRCSDGSTAIRLGVRSCPTYFVK